MHGAAARWLEAQAERAGRSDEFAGLIAGHLERADELSGAAEWYQRAGERAQASSALAEAKRFFDQALALLAPGDRAGRWRALRGREEVLGLRGEREAQRADLEALTALADELDDRERQAEAAYRRTGYFIALSDVRAGVGAAEDAIAAAQRAGNRSLEVRARGRLSTMLARVGELEAAGRMAEAALALVRVLTDDAAVAHALTQLGTFYGESGDLSQAVQLNTEAIERARRAGDREMEALGVISQGSLYNALGLFKLARVALEHGLRLCEAIGDRRGAAYCRHNLSDVYWRSGDRRTAHRLAEQPLAEFTAIGDAFGRAAVLGYLGYVAERAGDCAGAGAHLAAAHAEFSQLGMNAIATEVLAEQARCALAEGRLDEARQGAGEMWTYLCEHRSEESAFSMNVYLGVADIFDALGAVSESRAATEAGYRKLMSRADKITNPEWRRSFLENIQEHRALVDLWERLRR
ncbi:MAG: tetratricopeptide repeat protein [Anaerolineae bacterium]